MRRLMIGGLVAATTALAPLLTWAGNQEVADQIAGNLKASGQLSGYKVVVKYQDGTVWLQGRVQDQEQMNKVLKLVFQSPGVSVNRVVNNMTVAGAESQPKATTKADDTVSKLSSSMAALNPLRHSGDAAGRAQPIMTTDPTTRGATPYARNGQQWVPVALMQQAPPPPAPKNGDAVPPAPVPTETAAPAAIPVAPTGVPGGPMPMYANGVAGAPAPTRYDQPQMPNYAWPSYAAYPNYAAVTYPKQYSPTAWPYIGPFYPYPQVPLGWRKVTLEWDDGWWMLDFKDKPCCAWWR